MATPLNTAMLHSRSKGRDGSVCNKMLACRSEAGDKTEGGWLGPSHNRADEKMPGYLGSGGCGGVGVVVLVRWAPPMHCPPSLRDRRGISEDVPGLCSRAVRSTRGKLTDP